MEILSVRQRSVLVVLGALLATTGCRTISPDPEKVTPEKPAALGEEGHHASGYALLFQLMGDEQNLSKLLIVKREKTELKELVKAISKTAGDAHQQLEEFGKADPSLNLKTTGLPAGEVAARASISKVKAKELLTDKGKDFELAMLLSQNEALTYGEHLALTTGMREANGSRGEFLRKLGLELGKLRQKVRSMLAAHYTWQG